MKIIYKSGLFFILSFMLSSFAVGQAGDTQDTAKAVVNMNKTTEVLSKDTVVEQEVSPLDISKNRGLFILTRDKKMQLRILGSVRFSAFYDNVELPTKSTFNTYYIPTGSNNHKIPNFHNSLNQTRLGFEITRATKEGTVFIRIETDFAGPGGRYRIRHAYGQIGGFLLGQTWSLFSNVSDQPVTVDKNGPTGNISLLNPQIRYGRSYKKMSWAVGLEYSLPDLNHPVFDTIEAAFLTVQMIPDFTGRIDAHGKFGSIQLSVLAKNVTIKENDSTVSNSLGTGASLSGKFDVTQKQKVYFQFASGRSIAHYITTFSGAGQDAVLNPETNKYENLYSMGGFLSYGVDWNDRISTNLSVGMAKIFNKSFQPGNAYRNSLSASVDAFWRVIPGARIGVSYTYGQRWNKDNSTGRASRVWALFYYDF